jgi:hypothetical protein
VNVRIKMMEESRGEQVVVLGNVQRACVRWMLGAFCDGQDLVVDLDRCG